jgi:ABC-type nickel/cobalt efflux system permease component RcnA
MRRIIFLFFLFLIMGQASLFAQDNPFLKKNKPVEKTATVQQAQPAQKYPAFIQKLFASLNRLQRELNSRLSELSRKVTEEHDLLTLGSLLLLAFAYGAIHALGPGHGKIVMTSYAISNPLKARHGIALGIFISIVHTLSAILLVVIIYFLLKVSFLSNSAEPKKIITLISYGLFMIMGCYLLIKGILAFRAKKPACGCCHAEPIKDTRVTYLFFPALAIGLVPCEGTILLLVFSISIQALWVGIVLSFTMSLGMAVTISLIGLLAIGSRKGTIKLMAGKEQNHLLLNFIFETAGAVLIILIGLLFFFSALY